MKDEILKLECAKHIKIYKLRQIKMTYQQIADSVKTSIGHVSNVLKSYRDNPDKVKFADAL